MASAVAAATVLPAVALAADFSASSNVRVETSSPGSFILTDPQSATDAHAASVTSQKSHVAPNQDASALATATAEAGALHVFATGQATNGEPAGTQSAAISSGSADAASYDSFLLLADGYSQGTLAFVTASVLLDGSLFEHEGSGTYRYAQSWNAWVAAGSNGGGGAWSDFQSNYAVCPACSNGGTLGLQTIGFYAVIGAMNGVSMSLHVDNSVFMNMGEPGSVSGTMDLANTFSWAGITSVTVGGVPVSDFSAVSADTGFDYAKAYAEPGAVPEPTTWAMMIGGLGLAGVAFRRRQAGAGFVPG
jgi:hypothetical protein